MYMCAGLIVMLVCIFLVIVLNLVQAHGNYNADKYW